MNKHRDILHVDLNNYYASVESIINPSLKGRPLAVCGDPLKRHGIVLAKNNEAKRYGVSTGEPIWKAREKCRDLVVTQPHYSLYTKISRQVYDIYTRYTPQVESFGLDECWLDVSGVLKLFGSAEDIAYSIKDTVKKETGGLTVSVGVSFSKAFAKLGSDLKKPDAVSVINERNYQAVAWPLSVGDLLMVGSSTRKNLAKMGIDTIGELACADRNMLLKRFGKTGDRLWHYANGTDEEPVSEFNAGYVPQSVGNGTTTAEDITNRHDAESVVYALCEVIGYRLRKYGLSASSVALNLRNTALKSFTRQLTLRAPTSSASDIAEAALYIMDANYDFKSELPVRAITVAAYNLLSASDIVQSSFFESDNRGIKVESSVDILRNKYGYGVLKRGINLDTVFSCDSREVDEDFIPFEKYTAEPTDND